MTPRAAGIDIARNQAVKLLKKFGVQAVEHVLIEGFAERLGIIVVVVKLDGAIAQLVVVDGVATIVLSDRLTDPGERRFTIAHEIGHFLFKHPSPPVEELCAPRPRDHRSEERDHEDEADAFASELLMPAFATHKFCEQLPITLHTAAELARLCSVSLVAAAIRIAELTDQVCAVVLSEAGVIRWAVPSRAFRSAYPASLVPEMPLRRFSMARRMLDGQAANDRPALVPGAAWLETAMPTTILEHSAFTATPGTVVTILWMIWGPLHDPQPPGQH